MAHPSDFILLFLFFLIIFSACLESPKVEFTVVRDTDHSKKDFHTPWQDNSFQSETKHLQLCGVIDFIGRCW